MVYTRTRIFENVYVIAWSRNRENMQGGFIIVRALSGLLIPLLSLWVLIFFKWKIKRKKAHVSMVRKKLWQLIRVVLIMLPRRWLTMVSQRKMLLRRIMCLNKNLLVCWKLRKYYFMGVYQLFMKKVFTVFEL